MSADLCAISGTKAELMLFGFVLFASFVSL